MKTYSTGLRGYVYCDLWEKTEKGRKKFISLIKKEKNKPPVIFIDFIDFPFVRINEDNDDFKPKCQLSYKYFAYRFYIIDDTVLQNIILIYNSNDLIKDCKNFMQPNDIKMIIWQKGIGIERIYLRNGVMWIPLMLKNRASRII